MNTPRCFAGVRLPYRIQGALRQSLLWSAALALSLVLADCSSSSDSVVPVAEAGTDALSDVPTTDATEAAAEGSAAEAAPQDTGPCGDGVCDTLEQKNPALCPIDCAGFEGGLGDSSTDTGKCGDGVCDTLEKKNPGLCPADCGALDSGIQSEVFQVTNPASGLSWWCASLRDPALSGPLPTVVMVPGGSGAGSQMITGSSASALVAAGYVAILFDAEGRGNTGGSENYNGFVDQDGLAAVIQAVTQRPEVDTTRIGLYTQSFGITLGSGVLARHPALQIRFLLDYEGPADRNDTGHCDASNTGHITHDCKDETWWSEREARVLISQVAQPYIRIQNQKDHAQPDNKHCLAMVNAATKTDYGGTGKSVWTRVNDAAMNQPNKSYTEQSPPAYFPGSPSHDAKAVAYVAELFSEH